MKVQQQHKINSVKKVFSGSISIYNYNPKQAYKEIVFKTNWIDDAEYVTIKDDSYCLIIKKQYLEISKKSRKISKQGHLIIETQANTGNFEIDEETTEDKLIVYYK
jgi:hypothetical protein